jgi:undecaprenyl-diphosphatase
MMDEGGISLLESAFLGLVQGATAFLPVSSSGHLVIFQTILGVEVSGVLFEVVVHVETLASILLVYRARVFDLARGALRLDREAYRYLGLLAVATIPAAALGLFARDPIEALFENPYAPGVALLVTGTFLWSSRAALAKATAQRPGWSAAVLIGIAQAFALIPGISRSGATVVAALWLGIEAKEAAAFSFLMAVPAIAGAAVLQVPEIAAGQNLSAGVLLLGGVVAAITGVLAIRTFVVMLGQRAFHYFGPYCWIVGLAFLLYLAIR